MKISKSQLRQIIKEELRTLTEGPKPWYIDDPYKWVKVHGGNLDRDEEGQTIIYLSKEDYPLERTVMGLLPLYWDYETHDENIVGYSDEFISASTRSAFQ